MMALNKIKFIIYIAIFSLLSCNSSSLAPKEYVAYLVDKDNGLIQEKSFDVLFFEASFLTKEYLVCKSAFKGNRIEKEEVKKHIDDIEDLFYINIKIWSDKDRDPFYAGKIDEGVYAQRMAYANTRIINDFKLNINGEDFDCKFISFEPTHSISNAVTFALAFNKSKLTKDGSSDIKLIYDDKLFGLGTLKFNFNSKDIKNIPTLKL